MLGHIVLTREQGRQPVPAREDVLGLSIYKVAVPVPEGLSAWRMKRRLDKAARMLEQAGVRRVLTAPGFQGWPRLSLRGLLPVDTAPFFQAMAAPIALAALARRGTVPEKAVVCLRGNRVTRSFFQAAEALCPRVKGLAVSAPSGGEALASYLRREYGVAALAEGAADLTVCFSQEEPESGVLALWGPCRELLDFSFSLSGPELPESLEPVPLLAALWEEGRLKPEMLMVH